MTVDQSSLSSMVLNVVSTIISVTITTQVCTHNICNWKIFCCLKITVRDREICERQNMFVGSLLV